MNNKLFIVAMVLATLCGMTVVTMLGGWMVTANFLPNEKPTVPPPIIIHSPLNSTYNQNDVLLNFTIVGISHWWEPAYHITDLYYELDGNPVSLYVNGSNVEQHSTMLTSLAKGQHTLTVTANASGLYRNKYPSTGTSLYSLQSIQTVNFTITKDSETSPISSPNPTASIIPNPTETPPNSPILTQQSTLSPNPTASVPEFSTWIFLIVVISISSLILLATRKKFNQ